MADSWWDSVKDFAYRHAPERVRDLWEAARPDDITAPDPTIRADEHLEAIYAAARAGISDAEREARMEIENELAITADIARMEEDRKPVVQTFGLDEEGRPHREPHEGPAVVTTRYEDWGHGMGSTERIEAYMVHGELIARVESRSATDEEGHSYEERWYDKDGQLHSFNGNPSEIVQSNHYIPEESHLDESGLNFHNHGIPTNSIDRTYDDILAYKPIQVRNAYGIDLEGETSGTIEPAPQFPDRFPNSSVELAEQHVREYLSERGYKHGDLTNEQLDEFIARTNPNLYDEVLAAVREDGFEVREDRSSEILRLYTAAIQGQQTYVQPTVTKPMEIESYRQEQAFHNKHQGDLEPMTDRASVAHNLNQAADARRSGDLEGAREHVENARQDRTVYQQPDLGLSR